MEQDVSSLLGPLDRAPADGRPLKVKPPKELVGKGKVPWPRRPDDFHAALKDDLAATARKPLGKEGRTVVRPPQVPRSPTRTPAAAPPARSAAPVRAAPDHPRRRSQEPLAPWETASGRPLSSILEDAP